VLVQLVRNHAEVNRLFWATFDDVHVRLASPSDVPVITAMIRELAIYEHLEHEAVATEDDIARALFAENPHVWCHLVEVGGETVGFALWFLNYSTFQGAPGLYLEDLYVRESHRGQGLGTALMVDLARLCVEHGYTRFQWWVLNWNQTSIGFYQSIGAVPMDEWTVYRLSGEALAGFAQRRLD
jgi:GNAT superfamily N-acetyltransferase